MPWFAACLARQGLPTKLGSSQREHERMMPENHLVLLWWNTGLTPPVPDSQLKATAEDRAFVAEQISVMRRNLDFGILGLCEVQTSDLDAIRKVLHDSSLRVIDKTHRSGNRKFDIALIYDETKVQFVDSCSMLEQHGKRTLKLGERITFVATSNGIVFHVVLSHWPGRGRCDEKNPKRIQFGSLLRSSLAKLRQDPDVLIVLMGDYNDDPFSPSLFEHLLATRDRNLARRNPQFFYNPFWRWLGESLPFPSDANGGISICGTHYYAGGDHTEWFTYDQMIFTSAFLTHQDVLLEEELTWIISTPKLVERLRSKNVCDHFPVTSTLKLKAKVSS
jgi:hypothetical protein